MEVTWDDATSNDGWVGVKDNIELERVVSRGWLIKQTIDFITLAASVFIGDADTVGSTMTIPCGMIISKRELKVSNARSKSRHNIHPKPGAKEVHREPSEG